MSLTLRIVTIEGKAEHITVSQFEIVRICPYCKLKNRPAEFHTVDPDQIHCKPSHGVRMSEIRNLKA